MTFSLERVDAGAANLILHPDGVPDTVRRALIRARRVSPSAQDGIFICIIFLRFSMRRWRILRVSSAMSA